MRTLNEVLNGCFVKDLPPLDNEMIFDHNPDPFAGKNGFEFLGRVPAASSVEVKSSMLGVGFETLDRETFEPLPVIDVLAGSGIKHARCQTGWIRCEKTPGVYDFSWLDEVVDHLAAAGISTWLSLSFGNPLYTPNDKFAAAWKEHADDHMKIPGWARGYVAEVPLYHGEKAMEAWLNYVRALVAHFKGRVNEFEIWNEPEIFWCCNGEQMLQKLGPLQAAGDYVEFVRRTAAAVRESQPDAVIAGCVAGTASVYIKELGRCGLGNYIDAMCFHSYSLSPEYGIDKTVSHIRSNIAVPGKPLQIWQGESGKSSGPSKHFAHSTEYLQAKFLVRRFVTDAAAGIDRSSFFTVTDFRNYYPDGKDQYFGVINGRTYQPKLAFRAMQCCAWLFDGLEQAPDIIGWFSNHYRCYGTPLPYALPVEAFRRKGVPVFAVWCPEQLDLPALRLEGALSLVTDVPDELPEPVVIDPIRRTVYAIKQEAIVPVPDYNSFRQGLTIEPFTPVDYPVFITDRKIFDDFK